MTSFVFHVTGYVLGILMVVIIIAIGSGIVVGYMYKRSVTNCSRLFFIFTFLLCPNHCFICFLYMGTNLLTHCYIVSF